MLTYIKNYIITLRFIKLLAYHSAKYLQQSRQESHQHRYTYYYGFQVIYGAINKGLLLFLVGLLFNILPELLLTTLTFSSLRVFAGGLHFDLYTKCAYISLLTFAITGLLAKYIYISTSITLTIFAFVFTIFLLYAPVEHKNRPLKEEEKIKFKLIAIIILVALLIANILVDNKLIDNSITYGVLLSGIIASPLVNKIKK